MEPTSTSAPIDPETSLTEAEFLQQEAADAKAATIRAMSELKSQIAAGVDPRGWVEDHPWITLAGVAAASFVATSLAVPSKEQQALRKLASIEAAMRRESHEKSARSNGKEPKSLLAMVLLELLGIFRPILGELFANLARPPHQPPDAPKK